MTASRTRPRIVVSGRGLVASLPGDPKATLEAIRAGRTGISAATPFTQRQAPPRDLPEDFGRSSTEFHSGEVLELDFGAELGEGNLRPLDRAGRLASVGCARALRDTDWHPSAEARCGLVLGTMYGGARTIAEFDRRLMTAGPLYVKPFEFANSVINAAAGQAAIWHGLEGPNTTVSAGLASGVQAVGYATDLLRFGRADRVLAGGAEEFSFEAHSAFSAAGQLNSGGEIEIGKGKGTLLGEGAGIVALETLTSAENQGSTPLAEVLGFGEAFDPSRGSDRQSASDALGRAVDSALTDGGVSDSDIGLIGSAANGIEGIDSCETATWDSLWGRANDEVRILSVKPALGECLGASGAHQLILLIEALLSDELPAGRSIGLVSAVGFDGHHAALVVRSWA